MEAGPLVLGDVRAVADWLADVVRSGVEWGYRRANPHLFVGDHSSSTTRGGGGGGDAGGGGGGKAPARALGRIRPERRGGREPAIAIRCADAARGAV